MNHNHTPASAGGILNHGGTLILNASKVDDNTAAEGGSGIADDTGGMGVGSNILVVNFSQVNGNTANDGPMASAGGIVNADSSGDQGMGGGIANINLVPVATGGVNGGVLTIVSARSAATWRSGGRGGILEATITRKGPSAGGPLTFKFSQVIGNRAAQGGGIFAASGSLVTLKFTVIARNMPDYCFPLGSVLD